MTLQWLCRWLFCCGFCCTSSFGLVKEGEKWIAKGFFAGEVIITVKFNFFFFTMHLSWFLLVQDVCCDLNRAGREKISSECGQQPLEHFDVCQASLPSSRWKSCFAPWGRWRRIKECRCFTSVWHSLCLISGRILFHEQERGCVVGIKPNPVGLALVALWAWSIPVLGNIFLLASILDVKPKATFSIVCKSPGCTPVVIWEFFPCILPWAGICLSIPLLATAGALSQLAEFHVGLCKEMVWKQLAHPNCPQSCGTAVGLEPFFPGVFYNRWVLE